MFFITNMIMSMDMIMSLDMIIFRY